MSADPDVASAVAQRPAVPERSEDLLEYEVYVSHPVDLFQLDMERPGWVVATYDDLGWYCGDERGGMIAIEPCRWRRDSGRKIHA